MKLVIIMGLD